MLLAIDIGNTNIVFAVYDGNQQIQKWRHETNDIRNLRLLLILELPRLLMSLMLMGLMRAV